MNNNDMLVNVLTDDLFLKAMIAEDVAQKIIDNWSLEYGDLIDFGGNERDVLVADVWRVTGGSANKMSKMFGLPLKDAKAVIAVIKQGVRNV